MEYLKIDCVGSFLKNAGIVGLIRFLNHNNALENTDYIIDGQTLSLSVDYLKNHDISQMYVDTMVEIFEKDTKFYRIVYEENNIIKSYFQKDSETLDKKSITDLKKLFKSFEEMILNKSYRNAFKILDKNNTLDVPIIAIAEEFKDEKDINKKYELYCNLIDILKKDKIKTQCIYTELLYVKFPMFFKSNNGNTSLYDTANDIRTNITYQEKYFKNFYNNIFLEMELQENLINDNSIEKINCIECLNGTVYDISFKVFEKILNDAISKNKYLDNNINDKYSKQKKRVQICTNNSFMIDTSENIDSKKSYYWNCNPDAYVCPVCTFVYSFVPLGFSFFGTDAIFVNINDSIKNLVDTMETYRSKSENDTRETYYQRLFKVFSNQKIDMLYNSLSNIQVIMKNSEQNHYSMKIIDNNIIKHLNECKDYFERLEKSKKCLTIVKKDGKDIRINVYDTVLDNILSYKSQYPFIDKCIRYEISNDGYFGYIRNILNIEINFNGGANVEDLTKKSVVVKNLKNLVDIAFMSGKDMRVNLLGKENAFNDDHETDNSLRSYVYRLANLSSVGDVAQFLDTVIRMYSGYGLTIPSVFKECYTSEETFKAIAHGYILGLKYKKYEKKENDKNE